MKNNGKKTSVFSHPYSQMNATTIQKHARVNHVQASAVPTETAKTCKKEWQTPKPIKQASYVRIAKI